MRSFLLSAALAVAFAGSGLAAPASVDPLNSPSIPTPLAAKRLLLDLARAGDRLVAVGERGHIVLSDDEGVTWRQAPSPVRTLLTGVHFVDARLGWAVGHGGVVLKTVDGGAGWEKIADGNLFNRLVRERAEQLLAEADDGPEAEVWEFFAEDAEQAMAEGPTRALLDVWFADAERGIVVGALGQIFETTDGGATWRAVFDQLENPDGLNLYAVTGHAGRAYLAGEGGLAFRRKAGAKAFERLDVPYNGTLFNIAAAPASTTVAMFGLRGHAFLSDDGGDRWLEIRTGTEQTLAGGAFLDGGRYALVGMGGAARLGRVGCEALAPLTERPGPPFAAVLPARDGSLVTVGIVGVRRITPPLVSAGGC